MKKFLAMVLSAVMVLSMVACGGEPAESDVPAEQTSKGKIAFFVGFLGDKSFNDSGEQGMKELDTLGWEHKTIEVGGPEKADKYEDYILDAIEGGYEYVVASSTYTDICLRLAVEYPDVKFIIFDDDIPEENIPENMTVIFYAQNEGSYLVGMVAAAISKTGVVAVNVGMDNPVIADFVTGFVQGATDFNPDIKVVKAAVGSWTEPAKMKDLCLSQKANVNADVFYQVAGGSGAGLFEACKETGTMAIGVDSDQYAYYIDSENPELAENIVTSMLKEVGKSLVSMFGKIENGEDVWKKVNVLGLKENAVGYVDNDNFKKYVTEEDRAKIAEMSEKIINGEIEVKSYFDFANEAEYQAYLDAVKP